MVLADYTGINDLLILPVLEWQRVNEQLSEILRQLSNLIRIGILSSVKLNGRLYRVETGNNNSGGCNGSPPAPDHLEEAINCNPLSIMSGKIGGGSYHRVEQNVTGWVVTH